MSSVSRERLFQHYLPEADGPRFPPNLKYGHHRLIEAVLGRYSCIAAVGTSCHLVGAPIRILVVNAEERKKPAGKSDCASLDSSDSWDKVATSAEKTEKRSRRK